jgi:chromosomal replication initiation ATPase DnaA
LIRQLALPFPQTQYFEAADFLPAACNEEALAWLARPGAWPGLRLAVHGGAGTGKTHLLHLFASRQEVCLLRGERVRGLPDLPDHGAIAIDDADSAPEPRALLHLMNAAAERRLPVLLAATAPPARWPRVLPDLDSRLRAILAVKLQEPDETMLRALLARHFASRQLRVEEAVQDFLLARLPRHGAALREAAARLDRASLAAGRRVTRAIASDIIAGLQAEEADPGGPGGDVLPLPRPAPSPHTACLL